MPLPTLAGGKWRAMDFSVKTVAWITSWAVGIFTRCSAVILLTH